MIGPELYDSYVLVLKVVLIVISASIVVGFLIHTILDPISILDYFIDMIVSSVTALPMAFGWTTFGFAMGEFFGEINENDLPGQVWKPSDLPPIPDEKKQIKRGESIVGIIFYAIFIVLLSFSVEYFGVWVFQDEFIGVVPFLNEQTYEAYSLFIILILGFGVLKECLKLVTGKWSYKLAIFTTFMNAVSMAAILFIISGRDFWNPQFISELSAVGVITVGSNAFDIVTKVWDQLTFWIPILLILGLVWDTVDGFIRARKK